MVRPEESHARERIDKQRAETAESRDIISIEKKALGIIVELRNPACSAPNGMEFY